MHERNKKVASLLRQIGSLLDEQGVQFKPAAYRRAAQVLEEHPADIASIADKKKLMELPGVGEAIASKVLEFLEKGRISFLDQLLAEQGGLPADLMEVEDLGPKRIRQLQQIGINTVAQLIEAAKKGKLRNLPRFSEKMEQKILGRAEHVTERMRRFTREEIKDDAETILRTVRSVPGVEKSEIAGSYRRGKETVGDLDILVVTRNPKKISAAIAALPIVRDVVAHGEKKLSFNVIVGTRLRPSATARGSAGQVRVDIRFVKRAQWGSALLYFTGSKEHNIVLRLRAIKRGWKLNEYGLFEGEKVVASREEEDIYKALGLLFIEPTQRTAVLPL